MSKVIPLPENFIGKKDREKLESFGAHLIGHGRATRWHWGGDRDGGDVFEIYVGGAFEVMAARVTRDRAMGAFRARDAAGRSLSSGPLDHVMAALDRHLARIHGEFA